jgi:hypothetical protein
MAKAPGRAGPRRGRLSRAARAKTALVVIAPRKAGRVLSRCAVTAVCGQSGRTGPSRLPASRLGFESGIASEASWPQIVLPPGKGLMVSGGSPPGAAIRTPAAGLWPSPRATPSDPPCSRE